MSGHLERLRTALNTTRRTTVVPGQPLAPVVVVGEADLRAAMDELEQVRARLEALQRKQEAAALGTSAAVWCWNRHPDHPLPCGRLAGHDGQHARGEHRWDSAEQQPAPSCACGCQPGQPCGCGLEDCECAGDCPVCDHDPDAHTGDNAEDCPMCTLLRSRT